MHREREFLKQCQDVHQTPGYAVHLCQKNGKFVGKHNIFNIILQKKGSSISSYIRQLFLMNVYIIITKTRPSLIMSIILGIYTYYKSI